MERFFKGMRSFLCGRVVEEYRSSRPMTDEEVTAFDAAFAKMDDAFKAMDEAFKALTPNSREGE